MDIKSKFKDKLSNLLFLEMKKERVEMIFKCKLENLNENIFMPIETKEITDKVKNGEGVDTIPVASFVEGMSFVLGADDDFKFNNFYTELIKTSNFAVKHIKGIVAKKVKIKNYEDGYIMLRGLSKIESNKEIYEKLLMLANKLKSLNKEYLNEELEVIEKAKTIEDYSSPYLYEAMIKRDNGDYDGALFSINTYLSKGGEETAEISDFRNSLKIVDDYDKAKSLVYDEPETALKLLLPLLNELGNECEIYYYIAICYRILEIPEKAIYYLRESMDIDNSYPEVLNEMGINYACMEDFNSAIPYLRKVFELTQSIEVCTNLIMCYINSKDYKQAKLHLEIAKKIDPKDDIVKELDNILKDA